MAAFQHAPVGVCGKLLRVAFFFVPSAQQSVEIQLSQQVRGKTDALDALGNTTAATGKVRVLAVKDCRSGIFELRRPLV